MDITGKIIAAINERQGTSKRSGEPWKAIDYVIEWNENTYVRHFTFTVFGQDRINQMNLQVGQEYTISCDIDAHEYNGRWFNDVRAWRATAPGAAPAAAPAAAAPAAPAPAAPAVGEASAEDDLPF